MRDDVLQCGVMTKRRYLLLLLCLAIALPMGILARNILWQRSHGITRGNIAKIKWGMTQAEVESILGPPRQTNTMVWFFEPRPQGEGTLQDIEEHGGFQLIR